MTILVVLFIVLNILSFATLSVAPLLVTGTDAGAHIVLPA